MLFDGMRWQIGTDNSILCKEDKWIPEDYPSRPIPKQNHNHSIILVSQLIDQSSCSWNRGILEENFSQEDVQSMLAIPIPLFAREDSLFWFFNSQKIQHIQEPEASSNANREAI